MPICSSYLDLNVRCSFVQLLWAPSFAMSRAIATNLACCEFQRFWCPRIHSTIEMEAVVDVGCRCLLLCSKVVLPLCGLLTFQGVLVFLFAFFPCFVLRYCASFFFRTLSHSCTCICFVVWCVCLQVFYAWGADFEAMAPRLKLPNNFRVKTFFSSRNSPGVGEFLAVSPS